MNYSLISEILLILTLLLFVIAIISDFLKHRIANSVCLSLLLIGICYQFQLFSWIGITYSLGGFITGLVMFLPFYLFKGMAAGDVKLMAAIGAILGPQNALLAAAFTLVIGAVLAMVYLLAQLLLKLNSNQLAEVLKSYQEAIRCSLISRSYLTAEHQYSQVQNLRFPYAAAISGGAISVMSYQSLLTFPEISLLLNNYIGSAL